MRRGKARNEAVDMTIKIASGFYLVLMQPHRSFVKFMRLTANHMREFVRVARTDFQNWHINLPLAPTAVVETNQQRLST